MIVQAIEDQFPLTNVQGELIHKIHTQRFNLIEPHLQLTYSTNDKDLCDVAVSNDGKVSLARAGVRRIQCHNYIWFVKACL